MKQVSFASSSFDLKAALKERFGEDFFKKIEIIFEMGKSKEGKYSQIYFGISLQQFSMEMGLVLFELNADPLAVLAAFILPFFAVGCLDSIELEKKFGTEVAGVLKGVEQMNTASSLLKEKNLNLDLDKLRKMFLSMVNDVRVVLVSLAKQQIIMRNIKKIPPDTALVIAQGVMQLYAPLANRLGIGHLKWELEDRAFRQIYPNDYLNITQCLDEKRKDREIYIEALIRDLSDYLKEYGVQAEVSGRVKHIYSIYKKMQKKHLGFDQLFDIQAMRILVRDVSDCYKVLSLVHQIWEPIEKEFDDYISSPKPNGYRSIHTVVTGPNGKNIEIQIRTFAMHEESEMGVAAHWRYKEGTLRDVSYEHRVHWLRSLLDWQRELSQELSQKEILDDRVYVLSPQGKVIDLAMGSTPIDFAYTVHSEIGHRCRGAKVQNHIVPLTYQLKTGDVVEILTTKESRPSRDWLAPRLGYVKSSRVRAKIAAWFRQHDKPVEKLEKLEKLEKSLESKESKILETPKPVYSDCSVHSEHLRHSGDFLLEGVDNVLIFPAGCCRPISGDEILGYITQGKGVRVHRQDCPQIRQTLEQHPERLIDVKWAKEIKGHYPVGLAVYASDRAGLLRDLTAVMANEKISISGLSSSINRKDQTASIFLTLEIQNKDQIGKLKDLLTLVPGVIQVSRR